MWRILSSVFATQDVRLTGLYEDMHPDGFPVFLRGRMISIFQIRGDLKVEKLKMKMSSNSYLRLGQRALWTCVEIWPGPGAHLADGLVAAHAPHSHETAASWF